MKISDKSATRTAGGTLQRPALQSEIEAAITSRVRRSDPACAKFLWAYITRCEKRETDAGWTLKGVKYGAAPRNKCDAALATATAKMQARYVILEPSHDKPTGV